MRHKLVKIKLLSLCFIVTALARSPQPIIWDLLSFQRIFFLKNLFFRFKGSTCQFPSGVMGKSKAD